MAERAHEDGGARRPRGGFALVEVLVAQLLVGVALLAVGALHVVALAASRSTLEALAAGGQASSLVERLRSLHGAPVALRAALTGPGADQGCSARAPCPLERFVLHEAWSWRAEHAALGAGHAAPSLDWQPAADPPRLVVRLELGSASLPGLAVEP